jgi:two-component system phosphate regulon response regulator OmpR
VTEIAHILVVDDDPRIRRMLARYLEEEGYRVSTAESGQAMRVSLAKEKIDLILLDLMLPQEDGLSLLREIGTTSHAGVIMVSGRTEMVDVVIGLEVGADDYIGKPFHLREVLARVKSVLRRLQPANHGPSGKQDDSSPTEIFRFDGWSLDLGRRCLTAERGEEVLLTTGEFDLLSTFVKHAGRVLDRDQLMDLTRGRSWEAFDRSIDAQVSRLRKKIEADPSHPVLIKSVRGAGYLFTPKPERA